MKYLTLFLSLILLVGVAAASNTTPYNGNLVFLAHGNVSPFVDEQGHSITNTNSVALDTVIKALGAGSARFLGTSSQDLHTSALNSTGLPGDYTVMFWANVSSSDATYDAMVADGAYPSAAATVIFVDNTGKVQVYSNSASKITSTTVIGSTNTWHQIVLNRSSGVSKLFIDGNKEGSDWSNTLNVFSSNLYLGWETSLGTTYLTGNLDEVVVYNRSVPIESLWPQSYEVLTNDYSLSADFTASNESGITPLLVQFTDTSTTTAATIDLWQWDFGDGNTSTTQSPSHTYDVTGTHTVNLTITNTSYSLVSTKLKNVTVYNIPPVANFAANQTIGSPPLAVLFTDTSTGLNITSWQWSFGDGNTSTTQNPTYTYDYVGEYQVNLTVTNDGGSSTKLQNITVAYFDAYFIANKTSGSIPLTIQFTDTSVGDYDTWNWSVDDGTLHWFNESVYADRNLEYTFNDVGSWRVNLSVQNISESGPIYSTSMNITATNVPPVASYIYYPSAGTTSTTFIFNDTSTGVITTRNWSFGDGNYSATQNTTHVFPSNGIYNVNLTVSNDGGSSYIVHPFTVSAFSVSTSISPTSGVIPLLVTFNETYSGLIPDSYYWEFGDGATSTDKNTTHTYTTIGTFDVNHRIMNGSIISWANTTSAVTALGGSVTANFTADVTTGDYPLDVQFTDTSTYINATPSSWYWTFGDGLTSTSQNPSHTYSNAGKYSVNFTTTTDYGESSKLRSAYISVGVAANGRQDVILVNSHNITLYVKDANSGNLISTATVMDELGHELTSHGNGVFTGYYSTGQHTFVANATNYYMNRATYLVSGNLIQTIYLTQVAISTSTTWYTPKTIQISFTDVYGNQLRGASVSAHYNETTLPNGVSDLISNYGMNANVANEALNGTLLMSGSTDYQGSIVFTMLSTIKYDIAVTYGGNTNYYSIYPQDSQYQFKFIAAVAADNIWDDLYANGNTKVWATEPDVGNVTFWWSFQDMTDLTTNIDFYLKDVDLDTMVYTTNIVSPVAGSIYQLNYTVENERGKNYMAWVNYTRDV